MFDVFYEAIQLYIWDWQLGLYGWTGLYLPFDFVPHSCKFMPVHALTSVGSVVFKHIFTPCKAWNKRKQVYTHTFYRKEVSLLLGSLCTFRFRSRGRWGSSPTLIVRIIGRAGRGTWPFHLLAMSSRNLSQPQKGVGYGDDLCNS